MKLQKDKGTNYVINWKSKELYSVTLSPQYSHFLHRLKFSGYKIGIKLDKVPLVIKQKKCVTKIVNVFIAYELNPWSKCLLDNFTLKNCLFGVINIERNSNKSKLLYSGYRVAFDQKGCWSFGNGLLRNVVIFRVDNNSSSHSDNRKNNFVIFCEDPTSDINGSFGSPKKCLAISLVKQTKIFA